MSIEDEGIILVDKPKGITSFDAIRILRKEIGVRKMGHAGTLDPLATGLLIIGVGDATKKLSGLIGLSKTYEADIILGKSTDSGDAAGRTTMELPVPDLDESQITKAIKEMIGELELPVSLFSAIKREGKPLYEYAREGKSVEAPIRKMKVIDAKFVAYNPSSKIIKAYFDVSSGTYIRSLAEHLGKALGTCASITDLRRLSIGDYSVESARKIDPTSFKRF